MSRGASGRIVVEVDPQLKRELYVELARRDQTLKAWFVSEAQVIVAAGGQLPLFAKSDLASRREHIGAISPASRPERTER